MGNCACRFYNHKEEVGLPQLSQDLITQILKWLPVKSLVRFRCVSKSFRATIDSQHFVKLHLNCSAEDTSRLKLIFQKSFSISTNYNSATLHALDFQVSRKYGLEVYGYCNGVFLLLHHVAQPVLWNPSTHCSSLLPYFPGLPETHHRYRNSNNIRMGFGYDSSEDDYKVVLIYRYTDEHQPLIVEYQVWIFGLRSNSWKRVCSDFLSGDMAYAFPHFGYFADGNLHWSFVNLTNCVNIIVAFDLAKETFSIVTQPYHDQVKGSFANLNVLDGSLCISYCNSAETLLYLRKKDGAKFTWSLLHSLTTNEWPRFLVEARLDKVGVMGYSKERDKIMLDLGLEYIVSYDLKLKRFQLETTIPVYYYQVRPLVESLVPVRATNL